MKVWNKFFLPYSQSYVNLFNKKNWSNRMTFHVYQWIWYSRKTCASTVLWTGTTSLWARISSWVSPSPTLGPRQGPSAPRCCVRPCSTRGCGTESSNSNPTSSRCPPDQVSYFTLILFITSFLVALFTFLFLHIQNKSTDIYSTNWCTDNWILCILKEKQRIDNNLFSPYLVFN